MNLPLVTIGIPTFNRVGSLEVAIASARTQTYDRLEILIADNGSTDGTRQLLENVAGADRRVRLLLHPHNLGPVENFNSLVRAAQGEYFTFLADDDHLRPNAIEELASVLRDDPATVLVGGTVAYEGKGIRFVERSPDLRGSPAARVLGYYLTVRANGVFYGLARRSALHRVMPIESAPGNDWTWVASLAAQGCVRRVDAVLLTRGIAGAGSNLRSWHRQTFPGLAGRFPYAWAALLAATAILRHPTYEEIGLRRLPLAAVCFVWLLVRAVANMPAIWMSRLARRFLHPRFRALVRQIRAGRQAREAELVDPRS